MTTLLLSAAGAALGGGVGGAVLGLSTIALGKAAGATLGSILDQRLLGLGASPVETGRVERLRIMDSSEGSVLPRVFGRMRLAGQIIWSSRFLESVSSERVGGKGGGPAVRQYGYSISLAVALCEGKVLRIGRIWADGQALAQAGLTWRLYRGTEDQLPDPLIHAIEGDGRAPAYRGTAYVIFENLDLTPFGNRIPQFNFEVFRRPASGVAGGPRHPALDVRGVALVPGTGEYALATEPIALKRGRGDTTIMNVNNDRGLPDLVVSLDQMADELPGCRSVSLVVSWFGDDLRCDRCLLQPAVEQPEVDGVDMPWFVSGVGRAEARQVSWMDGRPTFGGTPADAAVVQAIREMNSRGLSVMFYPFLLMDILRDNTLDNPWHPGTNQPAVPWRGRITLSRAPGKSGSPDKSATAAEEVGSFFGTATAANFRIADNQVTYFGTLEWSYRRFVLHYAHLCALAGGVDAFCIGSEMRSLTRVRDGQVSYPAVREFCSIAEEVREILGPKVKIGYAADWSEYFGHQPLDGSGDLLYHLDPLWAHHTVDFVGIDNYMPLSDWRDGSDHSDAEAGSIYSFDYLRSNITGGEGYDWYYIDEEGRAAQSRLPITDGAYGEDWVFRYKDLFNWWSRRHENRVGGIKVGDATAWQPRSKPIWFTELGCPAVEKGTNQPNVFYDPKSSESFFPYFSTGARDDFIQLRYLQAMYAHWNDPANNPTSDVYTGRMIDLSRTHVWAWDSRPWPDFPARLETWTDGENHERGHWLNGRMSNVELAEVVAEIAGRVNVTDISFEDLYGVVAGYSIGGIESGRQSLQPLMMAYAFDSFAYADKLFFAGRNRRVAFELDPVKIAVSQNETELIFTRSPNAETSGRISLSFVHAESDYQTGAAHAIVPDASESNTSQASLPLVLKLNEARVIAERWLGEARIARDTVSFVLPPSTLSLTAGDVIAVSSEGHRAFFRIDRIDERGSRDVNAVRIESAIYVRPSFPDQPASISGIVAPTPVYFVFLDLPLLNGGEIPHAPHLAVTKRRWMGRVSVYSASEDFGYELVGELSRPATIGVLLDPLNAAKPGLWMPFSIRVRLDSGHLVSRSKTDVLNGANAAALRFGEVGDWEVIQFTTAELVARQVYQLGGLLRGQAGTDGVMPGVWPAGTEFVLIDGAVGQINLAVSARGLARHYRIGPSRHSYDHPSFLHHVEPFVGVGLRPYRPVHLAARRLSDGAILVSWVRRTRIDGDAWQGTEVPMGEERLQFHLKVLSGMNLVREFEPLATSQVYSVAEQASDGLMAGFAFEVAQVSDRFGVGPYGRVEFDG